MTETTQQPTWSAGALAFYTEEPRVEDAAEYASELINIYAQSLVDAQDGNPIEIAMDLAAAEIAEETAASYPWVGANDTASREAIYTALNNRYTSALFEGL